MTRIAAWAVLRSGSATPLREIERFARDRGLDARDRALLRRLVGTEIRRRGTLRAIVKAFAHKPLKPELVSHLHLGVAQLLFFDRVPDHAALSETNRAVAETIGQSKVPIVNGILRAVLRARREEKSGDPRRDLVGTDLSLDREVFRDPVRHPLLWAEDALSIPAALMKRWTRRFRRDPAEALARYFLGEPPLVLRAVRVERDAVLGELVAAGIDAVAGRGAWSIVAPAESVAAVTASRAFAEGRLTVQGETAHAAARLLEAREGERLLDLCAAPGGKACVLAEAGANVVAVDLDPRRLVRVAENVRRLGLEDRVRTLAGDGARALSGESFDGALVDAPCSNTGVLGARPAARWRFGASSMRSLEELQRRLLDEAAGCVRPGGRLVWSTCSLEPEENQRRVAAFLAGHPGWRLEEELACVPDPHAGPRDGGYAARLRYEAPAGH